MPEKTIDAFADHGERPRRHRHRHLRAGAGGVRRARRASASTSTDVFDVLETEGVEKFEASWDELLDTVKRSELGDEPRCARPPARRRVRRCTRRAGVATAGSRRERRPRPGWRSHDRRAGSVDEPAAGPARQAAAADRGPVRPGDLRGHRRPGAQEADAGDLRPGQPRAAAAGLRAGRVRPPRLGRPRTSARSSTTPSASTPAPRSGRTCGTASPRGSGSCQGSFDDDDVVRPPGADRRRTSTGSAAPAATTRSTCPSRPARSRWCASSSPGPGSRPRTATSGAGSSSRSRSGTTWSRRSSSTSIVNDVFPEESVFRIDHYLGKETVQNILALRFANQLFEPIWNSHYVDHVQITMAEDIGLGGRAGYYDGIGAARDVIQNHLLQLLAFTAMEEPTSFSARRAARREDQGPQRHPPRVPAGRDHGARPVRRRLAGRRAGARPQGGGGLRPELHDRDVRGDHLRGRRPGAGPACRSTCAPASGWAGGSPRSPWCSSGRRTCRSTPR